MGVCGVCVGRWWCPISNCSQYVRILKRIQAKMCWCDAEISIKAKPYSHRYRRLTIQCPLVDSDQTLNHRIPCWNRPMSFISSCQPTDIICDKIIDFQGVICRKLFQAKQFSHSMIYIAVRNGARICVICDLCIWYIGIVVLHNIPIQRTGYHYLYKYIHSPTIDAWRLNGYITISWSNM